MSIYLPTTKALGEIFGGKKWAVRACRAWQGEHAARAFVDLLYARPNSNLAPNLSQPIRPK